MEAALANALSAATAAGQWAVVAQLAAELEARRSGAEPPKPRRRRKPGNVISLDRARRKRENEKK